MNEALLKARRQRWHHSRKVKWAFVHVTVDREEHAALKAEAARQRVTLSELFRTYLTWGLETDKVS